MCYLVHTQEKSGLPHCPLLPLPYSPHILAISVNVLSSGGISWNHPLAFTFVHHGSKTALLMNQIAPSLPQRSLGTYYVPGIRLVNKTMFQALISEQNK